MATTDSQALEDSFFPAGATAGGDITQLRRKLAGKASNLGRVAIPWAIMLAVMKLALLFYGIGAFRYIFDIWNYEVVALPYAQTAALLCMFLQVMETCGNVIQGADWSVYIHHIITGGAATACYLYGSDRTLAGMSLSYFSEIVAASYQTSYICKHLQQGASKVNYYALGSASWINVLLRGPIFVCFGIICLLDLYYHYTTTTTTAFPCSDQLQPGFALQFLIANVILLKLDLSWNPKICRYMEGIRKVLDAEDDTSTTKTKTKYEMIFSSIKKKLQYILF